MLQTLALLASITLGGQPPATAPAPAPAPTAPAPAVAASKGVDLAAERAAFKSKILDSAPKGDGTAPDQPPPGAFSLIKYKSPAGELAAYLTPDPKDGQQHPAILVFTGGFDGIGSSHWRVERFSGHFRKAGLVVMCPSLRGQHDNPGVIEGFYGELDDALAALEYVRSLPYVDPNRIYVTGHSAGGTIALMLAEVSDKFRAAFPLGPEYVLTAEADGSLYGIIKVPFDATDQTEFRLRSPLEFVAGLKTPTFAFEGRLSPADVHSTEANHRAKKADKPFTAFSIRRGDHFNIVDPINALIASKIAGDTGPTCSITVTDAEVQKAFTNRRLPYTPRPNPDSKASLITFTTEAIDAIMARMKEKGLDPEKAYVRVGMNGYFHHYFVFETEAVPGDLILTFPSFKVLLDPLSTRLMEGTTISFSKDAGLHYNNPNEN
jgi:acetyl esterase/lipase/Fe-S cluster assembly iron-binding protein IscA